MFSQATSIKTRPVGFINNQRKQGACAKSISTLCRTKTFHKMVTEISFGVNY